MELDLIIGWIFLVSSWILPHMAKEKYDKAAIGMSLSALSFGVFIGGLLVRFSS